MGSQGPATAAPGASSLNFLPKAAAGRAERSPTDRESAKIVAVPRFAARMITGWPQMTTLVLESVDLAALLCSRVCHDVISPVGAIVNGLEVLEDEDDPAMREVAIELIKKSAHSASARLQFCRLAFGAAGSVGASIDHRGAESVARGLIVNDRTSLAWNPARQFAPKNKVKLLLNLCLIALTTIPRGGTVAVDLSGQDEKLSMKVQTKGTNARL